MVSFFFFLSQTEIRTSLTLYRIDTIAYPAPLQLFPSQCLLETVGCLLCTGKTYALVDPSNIKVAFWRGVLWIKLWALGLLVKHSPS